MQVSEAMTRYVRVAHPDDTIREAAKLMAELDAGFLPVGENDRLVGTITDRDITIRAVAEGRGPDTPVRDVMTTAEITDIMYCFEDEDVEEICRAMGEEKVRRLPVLDREQRLIGVISLGDVAVQLGGEGPGQALEG
ncbi:MAG: CBS domain-containing protein, partial [Pseudomonadota bacterium]|nr:CBS domain-containing protein [Pseudomonadota bacterium]